MRAAPRRRFPAAAILVLTAVGEVARLEARRGAAATEGGAAGAPSPPVLASLRRRAARRRWLPPAALLLAGPGGTASAGDAAATTGDRAAVAGDWIAEFFAGLDADGDGSVTVEEFLASTRRGLASKRVSSENKEILFHAHRRLFAAADIDGDSRLSFQEVEYSRFLASEAATLRKAKAAEVVQGAQARHAGDPELKWQEAAEREMREHDMGQDFSFSSVDFDLLDRDGNDRVTKGELWDVIGRSTSVLGFQVDRHEDPEVDEWLDRVWERADVSGDGEWGVKECDYGMYLIMKDLHEGAFYSKHLLQDMLLLDQDGNGRIEEGEIVEAQRRLQARADAGHNDSVTRATAERMQQVRFYFSSADEDQDGSLDRSEAKSLADRIASEL